MSRIRFFKRSKEGNLPAAIKRKAFCFLYKIKRNYTQTLRQKQNVPRVSVRSGETKCNLAQLAVNIEFTHKPSGKLIEVYMYSE